MSTSIVLSLDKRRPRTDGTFPLIFRLSHNGKSTSIATGRAIPAKDWNETTRIIENSYRGTESVTRLNNHLTKRRTAMTDIIDKLEDRNQLAHLSLMQVKEHITTQGKKASVFTFTQGLIDNMIIAERIGNARVYQDALNFMKNFRKHRDMPFNELNLHFVQKLEQSHRANGHGYGGLSVYLRTIRAIYKTAINARIVQKDTNPFDHYKIKSGKPRQSAISADAIHSLKDLDLMPDTRLFRDRNIFLMSFFLRGMPFVDLAFLKLGNFIDGKIQYRRKKNDEPQTVKIPDQLQPIMEHYRAGRTNPDAFLLPIIKRDTAILQHKDMLSGRSQYNKSLKILANMAGIEEKLTGYVARHSFATIADDLEIPITAISKMLGHQKISTTQAYIGSLRKNRLDDYQDRVVSGV